VSISKKFIASYLDIASDFGTLRYQQPLVPYGTKGKQFLMKRKSIESSTRPIPRQAPANPKRTWILQAAFSAFQELGYVGASTLEIATRAKVSKRELYSLFANKHAMLAACIAERTKRMRFSLESPTGPDRKAVAETLTAFGTTILREVCDPSALAVFRLAIAESEGSPEIAYTLDAAGRQANRAALIEFLRKAQKRGQLGAGQPETMAAVFFGLLWDDLLIRLLLRVADPPTTREIERRARTATEALLTQLPEPKRSRVRLG
jgi:AcrR family transcriptional regulator